MIEQIVSETSDDGTDLKSLSRLTRDAAARGRQHGEESGFEFGQWETAAKAVVKSMLCAGVLLTSTSESIPPDITAQATPVAALRERYQDLTEGFLLHVLIERLGDVTTRDHKALAHALFRQFDRCVPLEDLEDRVDTLLAQLADGVELANDVYSVRTPPPARGAPPDPQRTEGQQPHL